MTATLVQLFTPRTQDVILNSMYATASSLGVDVTGVQAERMFRTLYEIEATAKSNEDYIRVQVAQSGFLQTVKQANYDQAGNYIAAPNWLDLLALGFFNLNRLPAIATVGAAVLTCGPLAASTAIPARQNIFATATGVTFRNAAPFQVVPGTAVPITLVADVAGTSGNVPVGSITQLGTTIANCSVANPGTGGSWITVAGADAEIDDNLITRCLARWAATSYGGARSAYSQWVLEALAAAGISSSVIKLGIDDTNPNGPGSTDLYCADAAGPATLAELAAISSYLLPRRGLGTGPLRIFAAPNLVIPVVANIFGNANGVALGQASLANLQATIGIGSGAVVYYSDIIAALSAPTIPGVLAPSGHVELLSPLGDTPLNGFQVATLVPTLTAVA